MYYRVIPFSRSFDTYGLTYKIPKNLEKKICSGQILLIPYGSDQILGCSISEESAPNYEHGDIKEVIGIYDEKIYLSQPQLQIVHYVSEYYFCPIHQALGLYFPRNLFEKIEKQKIDRIKHISYSYNSTNIELSKKQQEIYTGIQNSQKICSLLYGVTGSGKTQIYMKCIESNLKEGKQTLVLIPEIILSSQIGERLQEVFGDGVIFLHSGVSAAKKSQYWMDIYRGEAKVIVGTRSALFYPYNTLGMVIMDEEHDESYISDSSPRHHTKTVAYELCKKLNIPLLLGSGTPKVESFYTALGGEYDLFQLLEVYKD